MEKQFLTESRYSARGIRGDQRCKFYLQGLFALQNGQTESALDNFRELLNYLPPTWDVEDFEDSLANAFLEIGRLDEAIAEYERILRLNPQYPRARFHLAQALERKGQIAEARENYRLFLESWKEADPDVPEIISARKSLGNLQNR